MNIKTTIGNNKIAALSRINHTFQDFSFKILIFHSSQVTIYGSQKLILQQDEVTNNSTKQKIADFQLLF